MGVNRVFKGSSLHQVLCSLIENRSVIPTLHIAAVLVTMIKIGSMRKLGFIFLIFFLLGCSDKKGVNSKKFSDEFYSALNVIIKNKFSNVGLVLDKSMPVYRTMYGSIGLPPINDNTPPPPPPPGIVYYNSIILELMRESHQIDSIDANYMYNSIDSSKILSIDSTKLNIKVVSHDSIIQIFKDKKIDYFEKEKRIKEKFGSNCIMRISSPVFNSNYTKILITIIYNCSSDGDEFRFVLEKKDGNWIIIDREEVWERN